MARCLVFHITSSVGYKLLLIVPSALHFISSNGLIDDGPVDQLASDVLRVRSISYSRCVCVHARIRVCFPEHLHLYTDLSLSRLEFCLITRSQGARSLGLSSQKLKIGNSEGTLRELWPSEF